MELKIVHFIWNLSNIRQPFKGNENVSNLYGFKNKSHALYEEYIFLLMTLGKVQLINFNGCLSEFLWME